MIYKMEQIFTQEIIFALLVKCNSFIIALMDISMFNMAMQIFQKFEKSLRL